MGIPEDEIGKREEQARRHFQSLVPVAHLDWSTEVPFVTAEEILRGEKRFCTVAEPTLDNGILLARNLAQVLKKAILMNTRLDISDVVCTRPFPEAVPRRRTGER